VTSARPGDDEIDADEARRNPEQAVDALERRIHAERGPGGADRDDEPGPDGGTPPEPAVEVDLDAEDQGSAAAAASNPD
jgi:hypothetical protein